MELAEGGDLFGKIESDVGISEDIAHVYFTQLIGAVAFMHTHGVAHRDIKPENILLSADGNLKIADFGLATLFRYKEQTKLCTTSCGSPPYTAPEVVACGLLTSTVKGRQRDGRGYLGNVTDIWSCGIVLLVLLAGNTPWDVPMPGNVYYDEYVRSEGRPNDDLWDNLPSATLSLLRGMMRVDPGARFSLEEVRKHPWFTRTNPYLKAGKLVDPLAMATQMFESLRIDFSQKPAASLQREHNAGYDAMEIDSNPPDSLPTRSHFFAATQPETPTNDIQFDWELPPRAIAAKAGLSASQPMAFDPAVHVQQDLTSRLAEAEPSFSQYSSTPSVPVSRTQLARTFRDILPSHSLNSFFSLWTIPALLPLLSDAFHRLGIPLPTTPTPITGGNVFLTVKMVDGRKCPLAGDVFLEKRNEEGGELTEVRFVKGRGDPVEWRRMFKKVVVLCREAVYVPEG